MASERKVWRRQAKYKHMLRRDYGVTTENAASRSLMLCNAGLTSGCPAERVVRLLEAFGPLETVVTPPGKSYSFASFLRQNSALDCYRELNGKPVLRCLDGPLYLLFVDGVPEDGRRSSSSGLPPGAELVEDLVTEEEERRLLRHVGLEEGDEAAAVLNNRLVKHYGYEFLYGRNDVDRDRPLERGIPHQCAFIFDRLGRLGGDSPWIPDQLTVNRYSPGQGIPSHIDTHSAFQDPILSLSLGSDVVMEFKRDDRCLWAVLPRRSLLIMGGESRYAWSHGIRPRKTDTVPRAEGGGLTCRARGVRTSLTFRRVRHSPCRCSFPLLCDSRRGDDPATATAIGDDMAASLESAYVHRVYDNISSHFSDTRHKPWPRVCSFVRSFPPGSVVVDVGCGNAKYFGRSSCSVELGLDRCENLIKICRDRGSEGVVADCLSLPLRSDVADCVLCIAVIHHLSTVSRRIRAVDEMARVTRIGGKILIYAWAKNQSADNKASSYLKQTGKKGKHDTDEQSRDRSLDVDASIARPAQHLKIENVFDCRELNVTLPLHENRTAFQHTDVLVPWKLRTESNGSPSSRPTYLRFYHVFEDNELTELCSRIDNVEIEMSYYDQGNWCVVLRKIK